MTKNQNNNMSKFFNIENKFKYPDLEWYSFNDITYYLQLMEEAGFEESYLDMVLEDYLSNKSYREKEEFVFEQLINLGIKNPDEFGSPMNSIADLLNEVPDENFPKVLYLVTNPDQANVPKDFNALTYPEYFEYSSEVEEDYTARDTYNEVLKKALDVRNNNLDARKFNSSLSTEQVVALATNKLKVMNADQEKMVDQLELDLTRPVGPADDVPVEVADVEAAQELTNMSPQASNKLDNLIESKKRIVTQKPQFNLDDLLKKEGE
jgi:hypothetical protein